MAFQSIWYHSKLPQSVIDAFLEEYENIPLEWGTLGINERELNKNVRSSKMAWISDSNWFCGMVYSYIIKANTSNFLYDIGGFEGNILQYSHYNKTNFYTWHSDSELASYYCPQNDPKENFIESSTELIRKLSISVQLSDENDYEGGELQLMDGRGKVYNVPKEKGTIIVFDSRTRHRVRKIKSGTRKSLVGWVLGPRWK